MYKKFTKKNLSNLDIINYVDSKNIKKSRKNNNTSGGDQSDDLKKLDNLLNNNDPKLNEEDKKKIVRCFQNTNSFNQPDCGKDEKGKDLGQTLHLLNGILDGQKYESLFTKIKEAFPQINNLNSFIPPEKKIIVDIF